MTTKITEGVSITVKSTYKGVESMGNQSYFAFAYKIMIKNLSNHPIQLVSRFWEIVEANGIVKYVEGEGVVGKQPLLYPNEEFEYISGVLLESEMGKMSGHYIMENKYNKERFEVYIPTFHLVAPLKMN